MTTSQFKSIALILSRTALTDHRSQPSGLARTLLSPRQLSILSFAVCTQYCNKAALGAMVRLAHNPLVLDLPLECTMTVVTICLWPTIIVYLTTMNQLRTMTSVLTLAERAIT
ncbi:hypothetical protein BU24DRAFT_424468 [Aaosphaeria arxii CBS 175.79]|uniref:Uncharacterized protein n=1 Tax=Aaosphaeria arxii CBS 175.79 TaxID=1450172 RepID=A0A6A5XKH8_9PLEO|nr:uncharacterized protein BU24DRAFT_424468 [Aaosphaeria arxii CBS 175.79]KAF2013453.1 hypothetical protein BU24DRAFT_424468 [Aaosphaeria arxii CBS 175.79]